MNDDQKIKALEILQRKGLHLKFGLCHLVDFLFRVHAIRHKEFVFLNSIIPHSRGYVWPPGEWEPRKDWIQVQINEIKNKSQDNGRS